MQINRISQQHLNILESCPRKFQYLYLDGLHLPVEPAKQERIKFGNQFHLLMQQKELGLDIRPILKTSQDLADCFQSLEKSLSTLLTADQILNNQANQSNIFRQAEYNLNLNYQNYIITVIYDLLITDEKSAHIYDWKTYPLPEETQKIINNWQTRLYLFVLAEATGYLPENMTMTYWFIRANKSQKAEHLTINYDKTQHAKNRQDLDNLLEKLTDYLTQKQTEEKPFPQVNMHQDICQSCKLINRCQNQQSQLDIINQKTIEDAMGDHWLNIDSMPEIFI